MLGSLLGGGGQSAVQGKRQGGWLLWCADVAGSLIMGNVNLGQNSATGMSFLAEVELTHCLGVLRVVKTPPGILTRRGETPVKVSSMVPFLSEYPNRPPYYSSGEF